MKPLRTPAKSVIPAVLAALLLVGCAPAPDGPATVDGKSSTAGYYYTTTMYVDKTPIISTRYQPPTWSIKLRSGDRNFSQSVDNSTYDKLRQGDTVCFRDNRIVSFTGC